MDIPAESNDKGMSCMVEILEGQIWHAKLLSLERREGNMHFLCVSPPPQRSVFALAQHFLRLRVSCFCWSEVNGIGVSCAYALHHQAQTDYAIFSSCTLRAVPELKWKEGETRVICALQIPQKYAWKRAVFLLHSVCSAHKECEFYCLFLCL